MRILKKKVKKYIKISCIIQMILPQLPSHVLSSALFKKMTKISRKF